MKRVQKMIACLATVFIACCSVSFASCGEEKEGGRVLLVSIDGMRPDAIDNTQYGQYLKTVCSYTLKGTTIMPSITLPSHMSMFYSVEPSVHGVNSNLYTPSESLGMGITESLAAAGKTSALFYNWKEIESVTTGASVSRSEFISGYAHGWEQSNAMLGEACIEHIKNQPTDFTFLYLGFLDEWGHAHGWLSEEYYYALNESLALVERVIAVLPEDYTVIITTDHGGHDRGHGLDIPEDMTIPIFVKGNGYRAGRRFYRASILDVAPTVLRAMAVETPDVWAGKAL